jgi:hypothetical protein
MSNGNSFGEDVSTEPFYFKYMSGDQNRPM